MILVMYMFFPDPFLYLFHSSTIINQIHSCILVIHLFIHLLISQTPISSIVHLSIHLSITYFSHLFFHPSIFPFSCSPILQSVPYTFNHASKYIYFNQAQTEFFLQSLKHFPARIIVSAPDSPHARHADPDAREAESKRSWSNVQVPTQQPQVRW